MGLASLMRPQGPLPDVPFVGCRYAVARTMPRRFSRLNWPGGVMSSPLRLSFARLRDPQAFLGKCGECRYQAICAGCRARAFSETGDYMEAEPFCTYEPSLDADGSA